MHDCQTIRANYPDSPECCDVCHHSESNGLLVYEDIGPHIVETNKGSLAYCCGLKEEAKRLAEKWCEEDKE